MAGTIDLGEAQRKAEEDAIWATRGKAIQAYAGLEHSLCTLFGHLGTISPIVAGTIFFKITSQDVRNKILEKLFRMKYGTTYNLFFNSFLKQLRPIDKKRNAIVHWDALNTVGTDGAGEVTSLVTLKPPGYWGISPDMPTITTRDLIEFSNQCEFYMRLCNIFYVIESGLTKNAPQFDAKPWLGIFQQPIIYPPPEDHPLFPTPPASNSQLQLSPA